MAVAVSVVVVTKNEETRIGACLQALSAFDDVWVVDSHSHDRTCEIARQHGAHVVLFSWGGRYPKKRQWCLDHLSLKYERVFFVDADEIVPPALVREISALDWRMAGYFVPGVYRIHDIVLKHGLRNNKLVLLDRGKIEFPVVDDLDLSGMGEIEGHYQPVLKPGFTGEAIGRVQTPLEHLAYDDVTQWKQRHWRYAQWEAGMNAKGAWPKDPRRWRQVVKQAFRVLPCRGALAFLHCYVFKLGLLDGQPGFSFALSRRAYYRMISYASKARGRSGGVATARFVPSLSLYFETVR